jgi:BON domain
MARHPEFHRMQTRPAPANVASTFDEDPRTIAERTRRYGERPHGWGNYESNYALASSEPRRVDSGPVDPTAPARKDHRGKGPSGYQRSDERQREIACELLTEDPRIDATDVDVRVQDGQITLTGFVDSRRTKFLIEELLANSLHGDIMNRLQVRRPQDTSAARELARNWPVD